ncbi:uncharacterized protein LOC119106355 [Pollicipes pollicipes]|uniref:uncharacterized protein LOC119106355 n=1 Tax=Pollicipes pollicipes TaxID=41117 RepID=UPI001884EEC9|nr:uncharacterized protein LOC119106355 [Pollicipes pollicipes]
MGFRRLSSCCCCDLQSGVVSIGITLIILNSMGVVLMALTMNSENMLRAEIAADPSLFESSQPTDEEIEVMVANTQALLSILLAVGAGSLPFDVLLLVAVWKRQHLCLLCWLLWYSLMTLLGAAWALYLVLIFAINGERSAEVWLYVGAQLASNFVGWYFVAVVASYYLYLRDERSGASGFYMEQLQSV